MEPETITVAPGGRNKKESIVPLLGSLNGCGSKAGERENVRMNGKNGKDVCVCFAERQQSSAKFSPSLLRQQRETDSNRFVPPFFFPQSDLFGSLNDAGGLLAGRAAVSAAAAASSVAAAEAALVAVEMKHQPNNNNNNNTGNNSSSSASNGGLSSEGEGGAGGGSVTPTPFATHIKSDMMYAMAAGIPPGGLPVTAAAVSPPSSSSINSSSHGGGGGINSRASHVS